MNDNITNIDDFKERRKARAEQELRQAEEAGGVAWRNLNKAVQSGKALSKPDRNALARAMHKELGKLSAKGIKRGDLAKAAGFEHKELYRLTLPPDADPEKRGLRASLSKYRDLIKAIQKLTGDNISQLVERLTYGTTLHPSQVQGVEEAEGLLRGLEAIINRIDREFSEITDGLTLYQKFMETAELKAKMARDRSLLRWPFWDVYDPDDKGTRVADAVDSRYAYWERDTYTHFTQTTQIGSYEAIMYLPRIYLGITIVDEEFINDDGNLQPYVDFTNKYRDFYRKGVGEIGEIRDNETGEAHIARLRRKTGEWVKGLVYNNGHVHESGHTWLLIYPSLDNSFLTVFLYQPACDDNSGTLMILLEERALIKLKDYEFIDNGPIRSVYDRIEELMGYGTEDIKNYKETEIYKMWKETSPDILRNPILTACNAKKKTDENFAQVLKSLWNETEE
jgi:hypothetical protein